MKKYKVVTTNRGKRKVKYFDNKYKAFKWGSPRFGTLYKRKRKGN